MSQKYELKFEYYAGLGDTDYSVQLVDSKEKLLEILNRVFKDNVMIKQLNIKKI